MDKINLKLLRALCENARISYADLAKCVHLSAPAVAERIRRMEEDGVITGYRPRINLEKLGLPITALIECEVHRGKERALKALLLDFDEVMKIYNITGVTTFIVQVGVANMSALDDVIERMIDYCDTNTKLIMRLPVDDALPRSIEKMLTLTLDE
ncbi:Lrp/AsnC family transcriptional regulator [Congregibacter sp.]|uniref:Lrp/AsnC family transcriptional regulator n=1 Tax=Congregibacter sp. TaxID=2744308 RepID=UPI0038587712